MKHKNKAHPTNRRRDPIHALVASVAALREEAKALGVFTNDRELLECPSCGLMEDVACGGMLITSRPKTLGRDTGLRFRELRGGRFRCPECASIVLASQGEEKTARKAKPHKRND